MNEHKPHISVMLNEVLEYLAPKDGETYLDATFGAGGYSRAILEAADCKVIAFDRDPSVKPYAEVLEKLFGDRFKLVISEFSKMRDALNGACVDGVVFDLGVSSMHLDNADRGFSFMRDAPLDMRMGNHGPTAADLINSEKEEVIAHVLYTYGDEKLSRRIAREIVRERLAEPIATTGRLAAIVKRAYGRPAGKIDPATRTFQAIRIWVNDELGELEKGLEEGLEVLNPNGRMVVVSFHSLEDRIVKNFFADKSGKIEGVSRHLPEIAPMRKAEVKLLTRGVASAGEEEVAANPRARSAKLRAALKIGGGL